MPPERTRQVRLARTPRGRPAPEDFELVERPLGELEPNEVLVRTRYLSVDPYVRLRLRETGEPGTVMTGGVVGEVVDSTAAGFAPGDLVTGSGYLQELEWADHTVAAPGDLTQLTTDRVPPSAALGVVGMPGRTAYFGMLDVCDPAPGETVVVSAAAGAVGSIAGQLAGLCGARVVGIAGSRRKTTWLREELGFDATVNYATADDLADAVAAACPAGVDAYFDNVGGAVTDAVVSAINERSRIAVCGQIAHYNGETPPVGPRLLPRLRHSRVEDFSVGAYEHRYDRATARLEQWVVDGAIDYEETITEGLERAPEAFIGLFEGENVGKQLVRVAGP